MSERDESYASPFSARYCSPDMSHLFSAHFRITTFRKLWISLAKAEQKLGLSITREQIAEMERHVEKIDFAKAKMYEKKLKHDVMAHIHAFGDQCPKAKPILHLGATSTFVTDNTDLIQFRAALELLLQKMTLVLKTLAQLAKKEAATPCLSYTHFQPAQPTTVGKRMCLWLQDFLFDAQEWERLIHSLPFLGVKGATGTQSSFLTLFDGNAKKVQELETLIARDFGFTKILPIAAQTYTRKLDIQVLQSLSSFAASAHKMATDIRLLAHTGELYEKASDAQVGSSAMPYKRNPIYAERVCGLARFVMSLGENPLYTEATQWLERSLDDSSNRRFSISESFLGADAILNLLLHLLEHLQIDRAQIKAHLEEHMDHLIMENLLMVAVKKGADRQKTHERLRKLSKQKKPNLAKELKLSAKELEPHLKISSLIGRAPDQVKEFLKKDIEPFLARHRKSKILVTKIDL